MQDDLRNRIIELKKQQGVSYIHIAKGINISKTTISLFIKNERNLSDKVALCLKLFLDRYY